MDSTRPWRDHHPTTSQQPACKKHEQDSESSPSPAWTDKTEDNDIVLQQSKKNVPLVCGATQEVFIKQVAQVVIYIFKCS